MSQTTLTEPQADESRRIENDRRPPESPVANPDQDNEFHYTPIPVLAPVTLFLGLASLLAFVSAFGIIISAVGIVLGTICFASVAKNRSEVGGFKMTVAGLLLSLTACVYGSSKLIYDYQHEVPPGFTRVNFAKDISAKGFEYQKGEGRFGIHPDVAKLDNQAVFLKGFMYPTRQTKDITEFILAKDNGECCFGGEPKMTDMILVRMKAPHKVNYTDKRVSLAGIFKAGKSNSSEGLSQVYELQAQFFTVSKTAF